MREYFDLWEKLNEHWVLYFERALVFQYFADVFIIGMYKASEMPKCINETKYHSFNLDVICKCFQLHECKILTEKGKKKVTSI